jgi:hypothetical protein
VMPFDDLDLALISDSVMVEQIHALNLETPGLCDQVRSVTELLCGYSPCLRVIGFVLICQKERSARFTNGDARTSLMGRSPIATNYLVDFITLKVGERFSERPPTTCAELLAEVDFEFGVVRIRNA